MIQFLVDNTLITYSLNIGNPASTQARCLGYTLNPGCFTGAPVTGELLRGFASLPKLHVVL